MIDYILGVQDPIKWHEQVGLGFILFLSSSFGKPTCVLSKNLKSMLSFGIKNLKMNRDHYASWMVYLGGAKLVLPLTMYSCHIHYFLSWIKNAEFCFIRLLELQKGLV